MYILFIAYIRFIFGTSIAVVVTAPVAARRLLTLKPGMTQRPLWPVTAVEQWCPVMYSVIIKVRSRSTYLSVCVHGLILWYMFLIDVVLSVSYNEELNILASGSKSGVLLLHSFEKETQQSISPSHCQPAIKQEAVAADHRDQDTDTDAVVHSSPLHQPMLCE